MAAWPGQHVAVSGSVLFWWVDGRLPEPPRLDDFLNQGVEVCQRVVDRSSG